MHNEKTNQDNFKRTCNNKIINAVTINMFYYPDDKQILSSHAIINAFVKN